MSLRIEVNDVKVLVVELSPNFPLGERPMLSLVDNVSEDRDEFVDWVFLSDDTDGGNVGIERVLS